MESYIKALLYIYPRLGKIGEDYGEYIKNRALRSYVYKGGTEALCEQLAGEIVKKRRTGELKELLDGVLENLTEGERFLLEVRYFGRKSRLAAYSEQTAAEACGSERSYYRRQERLIGKVGRLIKRAGLTEEAFMRDYGDFDWLISVCRYIDEGKEKGASARESALLSFMTDRKPLAVGTWLKQRASGNKKRAQARSGKEITKGS